MSDPFYLLRRMHLFIALKDDQLRQVAARFVEEEHDAGHTVFEEGDVGDAFYIIGQGEVGIYRRRGGLRADGEQQEVTRLVAGDYFGEGALAERRRRNATVKTLTPTTLWKLDKEGFEAILRDYGKVVRPQLDVMLRTRRYAQHRDFGWKRPDEIIYLIALPHKYFLLRALLLPIGAAVLLLLAGAFFFAARQTLLGWLTMGLVGLDALWFWWTWVDHTNDWYVVTNQRVVDIDRIVGLYDSRAEAPLFTVRSTTVTTTQLGRSLDYGDVVVHTFSGPVILHNVPHPQATADLIQEQLNRGRLAQRELERAELKKTIRRSIGLEPLPAPAPPPPPAPKPAFDLGQQLRKLTRHFTFAIRAEAGDVVTYRKHPYVLILHIGQPSAGILVLAALVGLRLAGWLSGFSPAALALVLMVPFIFLALWWLYAYEDWRNDIYQVTPDQIIDIERAPLGREVRRAASLDSITNISYQRPHLLAFLLNFGTVVIQTGPGGEMRFFDVYDPLAVQQDIFRRREERATSQAAAAAAARRAEISQYFEVYHEVMQAQGGSPPPQRQDVEAPGS